MKIKKQDNVHTEIQNIEGYEYISDFFAVNNGKVCFWQGWIANPSFSSNIVIHHGLGEHSSRYGNLLSALSGEGINVFSYDARSHGNSRRTNSKLQKIDDLVSDLNTFLTMIEKEFHVKKPLLYGHSMGGLVTTHFALTRSNQRHLQSLIVSAPALRPVLSTIQKYKLALSKKLSLYFPEKTVSSGLSPLALSRDPELVKAYNADPLVHDEISFELASDLISSGKSAINRASNLKIPLLVIHGEKDSIVSVSGSTDFFERVSSKDKRIMIYPGLYHEVHNERFADRQKVLDDLKKWILSHV